MPPADARRLAQRQHRQCLAEPLEDAGLLGVDKGKGVKLLMLPPGYKEQVPDGL